MPCVPVCVIISSQQLNFTEIMDINILVQRLQHGDSFVAQNSEGTSYQVNRPPSSLSISAARAIITLNTQVEQLSNTLVNIQNQLNQLSSEYELIRNNSTNTATS